MPAPKILAVDTQRPWIASAQALADLPSGWEARPAADALAALDAGEAGAALLPYSIVARRVDPWEECLLHLRRPDHQVLLFTIGGSRWRKIPPEQSVGAFDEALARQAAVARPSSPEPVAAPDVPTALESVRAGELAGWLAPLGVAESDDLEARPLPTKISIHSPLCGIWTVVARDPEARQVLSALDDPRTRLYARGERAAAVALAEALDLPEGVPYPFGIDFAILGALHVLKGVLPRRGAHASRAEVVTETHESPEEAGRTLARELLAPG